MTFDFNGCNVAPVSTAICLGVFLDSTLSLQETVFNSLASGIWGSFLSPANAAVSHGAVEGKVLGFSSELKLKVEMQFFPGLHCSS